MGYVREGIAASEEAQLAVSAHAPELLLGSRE